MRLLGVDFGFTRIGLAVAETEPAVATPRTALTASGALRKDAAAIAEIARKEEVQAIVLGLPIEPSGEEGRMARICRQLGSHLEALGFSVELIDERLSSVEADSALRDQGLTAARRRRRVDGVAAGLILERYLNAQAAS